MRSLVLSLSLILCLIATNSFAENISVGDFPPNKANKIKVSNFETFFNHSASSPTVQNALQAIASSYPIVTIEPFLFLSGSNANQNIDIGAYGFYAGFLDAGDGNITNVGDIALNTISSDAGTTVTVSLGSTAGDDFIVGNNFIVVEGDTGEVGIGTANPGSILDVNGNIRVGHTNNVYSSGNLIVRSGGGNRLDLNPENPGLITLVAGGGNVHIGATTTADELLHVEGGDILVEDDTPHIERRPTVGDPFEDYVYDNQWYFVNKTDGVNFYVDTDNNFNVGRTLVPRNLKVHGTSVFYDDILGIGNATFTDILQALSLTDGILSINSGSITSGVNATFSGTGEFGDILIGDVRLSHPTGGFLTIRTDSPGTNTTLQARGRGAGAGLAQFRSGGSQVIWTLGAYNTGSAAIDVAGSAPLRMSFIGNGVVPVQFYRGGIEDRTQYVGIYGWKLGDIGERALKIGVGINANDCVSFYNIGNYLFDGSVGIGTTTPPTAGYRLEVNGNILIPNTNVYAAKLASGTPAVVFGIDGTDNLLVGDLSLASTLVQTGDYYVIGAGGATYAFVIEALTANIGIGTVTPGAKLQVIGDAKIGEATTNYLEVESDGTLEFNGAATVFNDLRTPVNAVKVPATKAPTWTAYNGTQLLGFSYQSVEGNEEEIYFTIQLTHSYKEGSDVVPHVHWVPNEDTTDDPEVVRWGLEYEWQNIGGTFAGSTTIHAEESMTDESDDHIKTLFPAIDGTGKTISSMLTCRLFRNSSHENDTYDNGTALALFMEIDFHFEKDTVGSRLIDDSK